MNNVVCIFVTLLMSFTVIHVFSIVCVISQHFIMGLTFDIIQIKMGRAKTLTESEKIEISTLKDYNKMSNRQIAKEISRSEFFVRNFLKNRENYGQNRKTGRQPTISNGQKRRLIRSAATSSKSARQLKDENNVSVSVRHVQRILSGSKYLSHKKMKRKPMLSPANIVGRLKFADDHIHWANEWRKSFSKMRKSSIWMVRMDLPTIGTICVLNQRFSVHANLAVAR